MIIAIVIKSLIMAIPDGLSIPGKKFNPYKLFYLVIHLWQKLKKIPTKY